MRSVRVSIFVLSLLLISGSLRPAEAADASVGVDLATSYNFRGLTVNNKWVAQPYLELSGIPDVDGLTFGVWTNFDLQTASGGSPKSGQFSEIDLYGAYELPLNLEIFSMSLGYTEYTYPRSDADADREINIVTGFETFLSPSLGIHIGLDGAIEEQVYLEGGLSHEFEIADEVTFTPDTAVGVLFQPKDSPADDGFSYFKFGFAFGYRMLAATLNVYLETDNDVLVIDEKVQGVFGISGSF